MHEDNDKDVIYHASKIKGLKLIEPNISTHGEAYVYGTTNMVYSILFLGNNFDFICQIGTISGRETRDGRPQPYICERFEGALEHAYKNESGVIYKLPKDTFKHGLTGWSAEVVSTEPVPVLEEIEIDDTLRHITDLENKGLLRVFRYPRLAPGIPRDKSDIVEKAVQWAPTLGDKILDAVERYHPDILPRVLKGLRAGGFEPEARRWKEYFTQSPDTC